MIKGSGRAKSCLALLMFNYIVKGSLTDTHLKGLKSDRISYLLDTKVISGSGHDAWHQMLHTYIRHNIRRYVSKFQSSGKKKDIAKIFEKNNTTNNHKLHPPLPKKTKKQKSTHTHMTC